MNGGMIRPLSTRHERFCEFVATGDSQVDPYLKAGYKVTRTNARQHAARLMTIDDIKNRIATLRRPKIEKLLLSRDAKREMLPKWASDPTAKLADRIRSIEIDAKLAGHFEPERTEVELGQRTLAAIEERAQHVGAVLSIAAGNSSAPSRLS